MSPIRLRKSIILTLFPLALSGCYAPGADVSLSPSLEVQSLHAVAVRPFYERCELPGAAVSLSRAFEAALLSRGIRVVPYDRVREVLAGEEGEREDSCATGAWQRVHEELQVDAVLSGTVTLAREVPGGVPPYQMDCAFRLIDTARGEVLASGNASEDGAYLHSVSRQLANRVLGEFLGPESRTP
jgi:hypothetical protein